MAKIILMREFKNEFIAMVRESRWGELEQQRNDEN